MTEIKISTDCECVIYDPDTKQEKDSDVCFGCQQDNYENYEYCVLQPFMEKFGIENKSDYALIVGKHIGWQKYNVVYETSYAEIINSLRIHGQHNLTVTWDDKSPTFTVFRTSHDEPTGATFEISALLCTKCTRPLEMAILKADTHSKRFPAEYSEIVCLDCLDYLKNRLAEYDKKAGQ